MPRLSESGFFGKLHAQLNQLWDEVKANRLAQSKDYRISRTSNGTKLEILFDGGTAAAASIRWRGEWTALPAKPDGLGAYQAGDLVIRGSANKSSEGINATVAILNGGTKGGLYIARVAVPDGIEPEEPEDAESEAYWETFARGSWKLLTVTEDGGSKLQFDARNPTANAVAALSALQGHDVAFREYDVCVNGQTKKAILWGSLPY